MPAATREKSIKVDFVSGPFAHMMFVNDFKVILEDEHATCLFAYDGPASDDILSIGVSISFADLETQKKQMIPFLQRLEQASLSAGNFSRSRKFPVRQILPVNLIQCSHQGNLAEMTFYSLSLHQAIEAGKKNASEQQVQAFPSLLVRCSTVLMRSLIENLYV